MLLRTDLDIYKYDRTGLFIMVPYITLKDDVSYMIAIMEFYYMQCRSVENVFWFFVGDIKNFILMHSYCHSSTKCSTTATLQTELFNRKKCNLYSTLKQI